MPQITRADLFKKSGRPIKGLENVLTAYKLPFKYYCVTKEDCSGLEKLKAMAESGEITPWEVMRYRGNGGSVGNPSRLIRYLFNRPGKDEMRQAKIECNFGAGI